MSVLDGVSQCWLLSETCVVNWNAWAAIGTFTAVVAALLLPFLQRWLVKRKANALLLFSFMHDVIDALDVLRSMDKKAPLGKETDEALFAEGTFAASVDQRRAYAEEMEQRLGRLISREVDLTKWTSVDLSLIALVVLAIESCKAAVSAANAMKTEDAQKMQLVFTAIRGAVDAANNSLGEVNKRARKEVAWLISESMA